MQHDRGGKELYVGEDMEKVWCERFFLSPASSHPLPSTASALQEQLLAGTSPQPQPGLSAALVPRSSQAADSVIG